MKVVIERLNQVDDHHEMFGQSSFRRVHKDKEIPVTRNFSPLILGHCRNIEIIDNEVIADIELYKEMDLRNKVFRPAGKIIESHIENSIRVVDKFELHSIGLINKENDWR